tara:strand:+ start:602 stop:1045 length:444 start_codon:yes stop_codon:yes gene_type:complete
MNNTYLLLFIIVICWTINPYFKKKGASKLSSEEFMFFNHFLCSILIIIYFLYLFYNNKCNINCIKKIDNKELVYSIFGAFITVISSLLLIKLLKENDASYIISQIQPLVILLTIIVGYLIFHEALNKNKLIGGLIIILGLIIINKKN